MMVFYRNDECTQLVLDEEPEGRPAGEVTVNLVSAVHDERTNLGSYPLTLAQAIQVRDWLNRRIDDLALTSVGSLAERASDDPTQLACTEVLP